MIKASRFIVDGIKILNPPGKTSDDVSCLQADVIDFLCEECGYSYCDEPIPIGEAKMVFSGWYEAEIMLSRSGFRYAKQGREIIIIPPDYVDMDRETRGWMRQAVDYLCKEWDYAEGITMAQAKSTKL
jgi:hypothetical protein